MKSNMSRMTLTEGRPGPTFVGGRLYMNSNPMPPQQPPTRPRLPRMMFSTPMVVTAAGRRRAMWTALRIAGGRSRARFGAGVAARPGGLDARQKDHPPQDDGEQDGAA